MERFEFLPRKLFKNITKGYHSFKLDPDLLGYAVCYGTPFHNYASKKIITSDPSYLDKGKVIEVVSYAIMTHLDKIVCIKDNNSGFVRLGILPKFVNKGGEIEYEDEFNKFFHTEPTGEKVFKTFGYIHDVDKITVLYEFQLKSNYLSREGITFITTTLDNVYIKLYDDLDKPSKYIIKHAYPSLADSLFTYEPQYDPRHFRKCF